MASWTRNAPKTSDYRTDQEYCDAINAFGELHGIHMIGGPLVAPPKFVKPKVLSPSEIYHSSPEIIHYFKENRLNHYSGDYRPLWKKLIYPVMRFLSHRWNYLTLCKLNNLHGQ
jgi:hypothetical protein